MIYYSPTSGDTHTARIDYRPRTCFLMTQLGAPIPNIVEKIRSPLERKMKRHNIKVIDAQSYVTGRDFLMKIWRLILAVPLGVAIIDKEMEAQTVANIFYEIGILQAYGKETLVIKSQGTTVPSDFVRTEYIEFKADFEKNLDRFIDSFLGQADYYEGMADQLEKNPLLSIDYLRRAYLISGGQDLKKKARTVFNAAGLEGRARNSVEMLLINF